MMQKIALPDESLFRSAFLCAGHGMAIVDQDGRFLAANPALCAIVGRSAEELHQLRFQDITHRDDLPRDLEKLRQLSVGEIPSYQIEKRYVRPDGSVVPIQLNVGLLRTGSATTARFVAHIVDLTAHKAALAEAAHARDQREAACVAIVEAFVGVVEKGDPYTAGHQRNVAEITRCIAEAIGLDAHVAKGACLGALLHDIGKVRVPSQILTKPGTLSANEMQLIREHPTTGYEILRRADVPWPVATIALQHHERPNGGGYPLGLRGEDICIEARIVSVADVYDSMASFSPYRSACGWEAAVAELEAHAGTTYDRDAALACVDLARRSGGLGGRYERAFHTSR